MSRLMPLLLGNIKNKIIKFFVSVIFLTGLVLQRDGAVCERGVSAVGGGGVVVLRARPRGVLQDADGRAGLCWRRGGRARLHQPVGGLAHGAPHPAAAQQAAGRRDAARAGQRARHEGALALQLR